MMEDSISLRELKAEDLTPFLNSPFTLSRPDGSESQLVLREVRKHNHVTQLGREAFSVLFLGNQEEILPQSIYALKNPEMGRLEIFLVPIGRSEAGTEYEAVFA